MLQTSSSSADTNPPEEETIIETTENAPFRKMSMLSRVTALADGPRVAAGGLGRRRTRHLAAYVGTHILIGSDTYHPDVNEASYFTQRLAGGMRGRGHEVHVLRASRSLRTETIRREGVVEHRMRSIPVPFHAGFRFSPPPLLYRRVRREVERVRPDVVHVQGHFSIGRALIRAARELGIPIVATNHFMPDNLIFYLRLPERAERPSRSGRGATSPGCSTGPTSSPRLPPSRPASPRRRA